MGDLAKVLRTGIQELILDVLLLPAQVYNGSCLFSGLLSGGEIPESDTPPAELPKEHIPHVYFKQYLPVSNKVVF